MVLFIFYVIANQFFLNLIAQNERIELNEVVNVREEAQYHMKNIENRLKKLQNSIVDSNRNVNHLNNLIGQASQDLQLDNKSNTESSGLPGLPHTEKIAVLVFSCNRPDAIRSHLDQLISKRKATVDQNKFPIIVSQDCGDTQTAETIENYKNYLYAFMKQPDLSDIQFDKNKRIAPHLKGYYKIARHYKWALDEIFMKHKFQTVILNEDDLNISPDFFTYFEAMQKVLSRDPSLFCVSAWNDNGKSNLIQTQGINKVHRSDFFPGLGWMMQRSLWLEMRKKWPDGFWDDWIREPENRKNRACIRPEIPRVGMSKNEAKKGVSQGQFLDKFLKLIVMNQVEYDWSKVNTDYLVKENYDKMFLSDVYNRTVKLSFNDFKKAPPRNKTTKILLTYSTKKEFLNYANHFGIMNDFKAGVPRTAYKGIVQVYFKNKVIYIAPEEQLKWTDYPKGW